MNFSKFARFVSIVVKVNLAHEIVNYNVEIKAPIWARKVRKNGPDKKTNLTRVFEEGVRNKIQSDYHRYIPKTTETKVFAATKIRTSVKNLQKVDNSYILFCFVLFLIF